MSILASTSTWLPGYSACSVEPIRPKTATGSIELTLTGRSDHEVVVDLPDRHGPLADRGRHSLHRPAAHVSGGEDTGHAGFQEDRAADRCQPVRAGNVIRCVPTGFDETVVVERDRAGQPLGIRVRPNEHE